MNSFRNSLLLAAFILFAASPVWSAPKGGTLDDLKKLPITCLVPGWLPEGYQLRQVEIDYSDREGVENAKERGFPAYSLEYANGKKGSFTIESARWGIGDRNLDEDESAEESEFETKLFGPVYIIYFPAGKAGIKERITANWLADATMKAEVAANPSGIAVNGRFHGVSGYNMTLEEFTKIVQSLCPVREEK